MGKLYGALIVLSLIWGTSFLFIKVLLVSLDPLMVVFGRCLFGAIMLLAIIVFSRQKINFKKVPWISLFFVGLTNNALPWFLICSSETKLTSGMASIINATTPMWTLIIGFFLFSTTLRKRQWLGIIIGFFGIFILSDLKWGDLLSGDLLGILFMIGATMCYGIGAQLTKRHLNKLSVIETSFFTLFISTTISFLILIVSKPYSLSMLMEPALIGPFLGLGALGSGVAYLLYYYMVKQGSPEFASLVTYLVPISAIIWGSLLLKEPIHLTMILGLIIIFSGVYISSTKQKKRNSPVSATL